MTCARVAPCRAASTLLSDLRRARAGMRGGELSVGKAILHVHSTFSDGIATVDEILDEVDAHSDVDVVGFSDHDDVRAFAAATAWKARHPGTRVQPLWGCEVTTWAFTHLLAFIFEPPYPNEPWRKFLPLPRAAASIHKARGRIIVPHVDAVIVGLGRRRLLRLADELDLLGFKLLTPIPGWPGKRPGPGAGHRGEPPRGRRRKRRASPGRPLPGDRGVPRALDRGPRTSAARPVQPRLSGGMRVAGAAPAPASPAHASPRRSAIASGVRLGSAPGSSALGRPAAERTRRTGRGDGQSRRVSDRRTGAAPGAAVDPRALHLHPE